MRNMKAVSEIHCPDCNGIQLIRVHPLSGKRGILSALWGINLGLLFGYYDNPWIWGCFLILTGAVLYYANKPLLQCLACRRKFPWR